MLGFAPISALPISGLPIVVTPTPPFWGSKGGIGGKKKRKQRHDDVEELVTELPAAEMATQMREVILPPMDMLPALVQARKAQADFEAEQDDEETLLLLM
jgi:hypothetical protein